MAAELGIKITGDASGIVAAGKQSVTALTGISAAIDNLDTSFSGVFASTAQANAALGRYGSAIKATSSQVLELQSSVAAFGGGVRNTNAPALAFINNLKSIEKQAALSAISTNTLQQRVTSFGAGVKASNGAVKDYVESFTGINTATKLANTETAAFQTTAASGFGNVINGANGLYGVIRKVAQILPGIGIGGIFGLLAEGLTSFITGAQAASTETEELAKHQDDLRKSISQAIGSARTEGEEVATLAGIVLNANKPYVERQRALDELKKINASYFGDLTVESSLYGNLQKKVQDYANALILTNVQKARGENLTKANIDLADAQAVLKSLNDQISARQEIIKTNFEDLKSRGLANLAGVQSANDLIARDSKILALGEKRIAQYDKVGAATNEAAKLATQYDAAVSAALSGPLVKPPKVEKDTTDTDLNKQLKDIDRQIAALEVLDKLGIATTKDIAKLFTLRIEKVQLSLPHTKLDEREQSALISDLERQAGERFAATGFTIKFPKIFFTDIDKIPVDLPEDAIVIDPLKALASAVAAGKGTAAVIRDGIAKGINTVDIGSALNESIKAGLAPAVENIANSLGEAFTGGGFDKVLQAIAGSLGSFIQDFGKILIKGALEILALKKVAGLIQENPAAALIIGIAAVAIGAAIKNSVSKRTKQKGFKEGGISDGPSSGYYALLHGKEVIAPYDKAAALLGGGGGTSISLDGQFLLRGSDLVLAVQQGQNKINRGVR